MSNLFNKIDSIDLTSILSENEAIDKLSETNEKFCKHCFNTFTTEGEICESCKKLEEAIFNEDRDVIEIAKEVKDQASILGLTDVTELDYNEQKDLIVSVLDRIYGEGLWNPELVNKAGLELGLDITKFNEMPDDDFADEEELGLEDRDNPDDEVFEAEETEDIKSIQDRVSALKAGIDGLDKTEEVSDGTKFEVDGKEYTKSSATSEINSLSSKLDKLNKSDNEERENAFGEEKLTEDTSRIDSALNELEGIVEIAETEGSVRTDIIADRVRLAIEILNEERFKSIIDELQFVLDTIETEGSIDHDLMLMKVTTAIEDLGNLAKNESVAATVTVDNIDQESKDKATIEKAIEIAGDKDTIDNDTFRDLRLKLANKDYDMVDKLDKYALVRGEDVIYTWLRAEDTKDNLDEAEKLNESEWVDPAPNIKIKDFYAGTENGEDDYQFDKINPTITFQELYDNIDKHSITSLIGDVDSDIRNTIINAMCDAFDINDARSIETSDDLPPYENSVNESVNVSVTDGTVNVSTDDTNVSVVDNNINVSVDETPVTAPAVEPEVLPIDDEINPEEVTDEPSTEEPVDTEEVLSTPEDNSNDEMLDDSESIEEGSMFGTNSNMSEEEISTLFTNLDGKTASEWEDALYDVYFDDDLWDFLDEISTSPVSADDMKSYIANYMKDKTFLDSNNSINNLAKYVGITLNVISNESETIIEDSKVPATTIGEESKDNKSVEGTKKELFDKYPELKSNPNYTSYADDDYMAIDFNEDGSIKGIRLTNEIKEEALQVSDVPSKVDHKRIELAKMESEDKVNYRVSYLKEDDEEIAGWDIDADTDEDAIATLDKFNNADEIADDLLTAQFVETGIDGVSSLNYKNTEILLSNDEESNIITINQDGADPIILKGDTFDEVINQLIYWFIMNIDEEVPAEMDLNKAEPEELSSEEDTSSEEDKKSDFDSEDDDEKSEEDKKEEE